MINTGLLQSPPILQLKLIGVNSGKIIGLLRPQNPATQANRSKSLQKTKLLQSLIMVVFSI